MRGRSTDQGLGALLMGSVAAFASAGAWNLVWADTGGLGGLGLFELSLAAGLVVGFGLWAVRLLVCWLGLALPRAVGLLAGLVSAPFAYLLAEGTLTGRRVAEVADPSWSVPLAAVVAAASWAGAWAAAVWLLDRAAEGRVSGKWFGILGLLGLSATLAGLDARAYVRLYPAIHSALAVLSVSSAGLAWGLLLAGRWRLQRSAALLAGALALAGPPLLVRDALARAGQSARVRMALLETYPLSREILALILRTSPVWAASPVGACSRRSSPSPGLLRLDRADIVLVTVDALRPDRIGCYGQSRLTPKLDRLCRKAVRFERAYCHAPHSSFSLAALQTGRPVRSLAALGAALPPTLAELLGRWGYETAAFCPSGVFYTEGKKLEAYWRRRFGFAWLDSNGYDARELTRRALAKLRGLRRSDRPFYLWVHYFDVHAPYRFHPGLTRGRSPRQRYDGEVAYVDGPLSEFLRAALRSERPTVVLLAADHGEEFGEHGGTYHGSSLYDEQVRVPLLFWIPGLEGRVVAQPVSLVDVVPTLADLVGLPAAQELLARSLVPLLVGRSGEVRPVHAEVTTKKMILRGRFKLIWDTWRQVVELYDLQEDPHEKRNLADEEPGRVQALMGLLQAHLGELSRRWRDVPRALALARLGDPQAAEALCRLLLDRRARSAHRQEAARRLAKLPGRCGRRALGRALRDRDRAVAAEAAIALGELRAAEARPHLLKLLDVAVPPALRHRAAIAAGRLGMPEAEPYLELALASAEERIRYRAAHYLGRVGSGRAVRALERASRDKRAAHLVAVALGRVGRRAGGRAAAEAERFLLSWLERERSALVRRFLFRGLGFLGRSGALRALLARRGPEAPAELDEALVRCGGLGRFLWGLDFQKENLWLPGRSWPWFRARGVHCQQQPWESFGFLHRTTCQLSGPLLARFDAPCGCLEAVLRVRVEEPGTPVRLVWNGRALPPRTAGAGWQDLSWRVDAPCGEKSMQPVDVRFTWPSGRIEVDHLLVFRCSSSGRE